MKHKLTLLVVSILGIPCSNPEHAGLEGPAPSGRSLMSIIVSLALFLAACQSQDSQQTDKGSSISDSSCYFFVQHRDTIELSVRNVDGRVEGTLSFLFYEKDQSRGTIQGEMKGDTLFASYAFTSEGILSHREVAFLDKQDSYVMGSGEMVNVGNRDVFKDRRRVQFKTGVILSRMAACK